MVTLFYPYHSKMFGISVMDIWESINEVTSCWSD